MKKNITKKEIRLIADSIFLAEEELKDAKEVLKKYVKYDED
jgi:hypothetical protein